VVPFDQVLKEMNGEAEKSRGNTAKITRLRDNAPDLADLVNQHRLDLECALSQTGRQPGGGDAPTRLTRKAAAEEAGFARGLTGYKQIVYISGE
jgi:hypothetical protein